MIKVLFIIATMMMAPFWTMASINAQEAAPACKTIEQFYETAHKNGFKNEQFTYLTGEALERFAANMDRISGGGHGPMTGLIFLTPSDQPSETDITVIEVFKDGCDLGTAMVPSQMVRKALGQGV